MEFTITGKDGDSLKVESANWLSALGKGLVFFNIDIHEIDKLVCTPEEGGAVFVEIPTRELSWMVRRVAPEVQVRVAAASVQEPEWELPEEPTPTVDLGSMPPPNLTMPETTLQKEEPETLAERLFDLSMDIAVADADEACQLALDLLLEFVNTEAASVARGTLNDPALKFVAARGPVADQIVGREVAFGEGLVGMCFDVRGTLVVSDVELDMRHLDQFDNETGFHTAAVLCVPIIDDQGLIYGVIQMLNPPASSFAPEDVEAAETVARTLASSLASRG